MLTKAISNNSDFRGAIIVPNFLLRKILYVLEENREYTEMYLDKRRDNDNLSASQISTFNGMNPTVILGSYSALSSEIATISGCYIKAERISSSGQPHILMIPLPPSSCFVQPTLYLKCGYTVTIYWLTSYLVNLFNKHFTCYHFSTRAKTSLARFKVGFQNTKRTPLIKPSRFRMLTMK